MRKKTKITKHKTVENTWQAEELDNVESQGNASLSVENVTHQKTKNKQNKQKTTEKGINTQGS